MKFKTQVSFDEKDEGLVVYVEAPDWIREPRCLDLRFSTNVATHLYVQPGGKHMKEN